MFRVMNTYMKDMKLHVDDAFYKTITTALEKRNNIGSYCITVNFNRYIIDIKLKKFTVEKAMEEYQHMSTMIACPYSQMSVRYNEGNAVRYRFATCKENKEGYYCDIIYGPEL